MIHNTQQLENVRPERNSEESASYYVFQSYVQVRKTPGPIAVAPASSGTFDSGSAVPTSPNQIVEDGCVGFIRLDKQSHRLTAIETYW